MPQPSAANTLSDAERIAILDKRVAELTQNKRVANRLEYREPFSAVIHASPKPMTVSAHFWCAVLTVMSFGLGIVVWGAMIWFSRPSLSRLMRFDVTPAGGIIWTKLPPNALG
jgi:hypothetical protein